MSAMYGSLIQEQTISALTEKGEPMDLKAKLVGIIQNSVGGCAKHWAEVIADGLIANGVTLQEWISVKDRLPEEDTGKVLCITKSGHYHILQWIETFNCWSDPYGIDFTNFRNGYVAYWMPLPQPPKSENTSNPKSGDAHKN